MVKNFNLFKTPAIFFGQGMTNRLPALLKGKRGDILWLTGSESYHGNPSLAAVAKALKNDGINVHFEKINREPTPDEIDLITRSYAEKQIQAVISSGGGSVIDAGKAVSAMLPLQAPVIDFLEGVGKQPHPGTKIFFVAIPTTAGTGSECTANAVLSGKKEGKGFKRSLRHENLVPDIALVDPLLTVSCPGNVTAASGMDAFTQLVESYVSVKSSPVTDALAMDGIRQAHKFLLKAWQNGEDSGARSGMSYAAMLSGITLANAGLGLVHGFASSVSAVSDIPHGVICGTTMAIVNRYNIRAIMRDGNDEATIHKYVALGKVLSSVENKTNDWYMKAASDYFDELTVKLNLPGLGIYGVTSADIDRIVPETDHKSNPVKFQPEELKAMLEERI